jgi:hypothetical protein
MSNKYRWVYYEGVRLLNVGFESDGSLYNPNNYPEDVVRTAVLSANARRHARRSGAAKKAAVTRRHRQQVKVYNVAQKLKNGSRVGPRSNCVICGKGLTDFESIDRGIGSECWQGVLTQIEKLQSHAPLGK